MYQSSQLILGKTLLLGNNFSKQLKSHVLLFPQGNTKVSSFYHLCVECFSQLSFDSEVYTKSATAADFVYISESNENWEKYSTQR